MKGRLRPADIVSLVVGAATILCTSAVAIVTIVEHRAIANRSVQVGQAIHAHRLFLGELLPGDSKAVDLALYADSSSLGEYMELKRLIESDNASSTLTRERKCQIMEVLAAIRKHLTAQDPIEPSKLSELLFGASIACSN